MKYITKQQFQNQPEKFTGEINEEPTMTVQGEHREMKDILGEALRGQGMMKANDAQYFRPDEIQHINGLYKASLDLTDIDALRRKTGIMKEKIDKAYERKQKDKKELQEAMQKNKQETSKTEE